MIDDMFFEKGNILSNEAENILQSPEDNNPVGFIISSIVDMFSLEDFQEILEERVKEYIDINEAITNGYTSVFDYYMDSLDLSIEKEIFEDIIKDISEEAGIVLSPEDFQDIINFCFANFVTIENENPLEEITIRRTAQQKKAIKMNKLKRKSGKGKTDYKKRLLKQKKYYKRNKSKIKKRNIRRLAHPSKIVHRK